MSEFFPSNQVKNTTPHFLNIDFDIFTSVIPKYLIRHFDRIGLSFMYSDKNFHPETHKFGHSKYLISLEVNTSSICESILLEFSNIIQNLKDQTKEDWKNIDGLVMDFGYEILANQSRNMLELSPQILKMASDLSASIKITTYTIDEDRWDKDVKPLQLRDQKILDTEPSLEDVFKEKMNQNKVDFGCFFDQAHQILMKADPLGIQDEYEIETSEILELLKSEHVIDKKQVYKTIEVEFRKWAIFPDSNNKCKFVSKQFAELWSTNKAMFNSIRFDD